MDLKSLMNDGPGEEAKDKKKSPEAQRNGAPLPPPPLERVNTQPTPPGYGGPSSQQTPLFTPQSAGPWRPPGSQGMTPLQTPGGGAGQYPFPQTAQGFPPGPGAHHRPSESYAAGAPLARPPSHGYQPYPHQSPSQPPPSGLPQSLHQQPNTSVSPTPSSHHSHTPQSVRQSPMSMMSHHPHHQPPQHQYPHQQSQPSTPLGPPPLHHQRSVNFQEHSPFHGRSYSGASNGVPTGSPANYPPGAAVYGSPTAYHRPSPQHRRTSDYPVSERERSESVSPKTQVRPRPPSTVSRGSSQQETHSRGSSVQQNYQAASPNHVTPSHPFSAPQQPYGQPPNLAGEVSQPHPSQYSGPPQAPQATPNFGRAESSLSEAGVNQISHQSQKISMSHLLTPASEHPPSVNGGIAQEMDSARQSQSASESHPKPIEGQSGALGPSPITGGLNLAEKAQERDLKASLKRSADSAPAEEPAAKQQKFLSKRKYTERPIWARLSKHNPNYHSQDNMPGPARSRPTSQQPPMSQQPNGAQPNGQPRVNGVVDGRKPWEYDPPLDQDLIFARSVLGKWEKTFKWNTPYPDMLRAVQDWLFTELSQLGDVGTDPQQGTIEIEAKIGTLMKDGERLRMPVANAVVIEPAAKMPYQFKSEMTIADHKSWNDFINKTIQESRVPGRVGMAYTHLHERDSFHALSPLGQQALPSALQRRQGDRPPRLRITRNNKPGEEPYVKARIVKMKIADLQIYNPKHAYDCRISINLEVNLDRPDLDPDALIFSDAEAAREKLHKEVDRVKDRLSYKHLAYSIDLTKVDRQGLEPSYELELEVDSTLIRQQMDLISAGRESAFGDVVGGFLDNATFLMRQPRPAI